MNKLVSPIPTRQITESYSVVLRSRNARKRGHWVKVNNRYGLLIPVS